MERILEPEFLHSLLSRIRALPYKLQISYRRLLASRHLRHYQSLNRQSSDRMDLSKLLRPRHDEIKKLAKACYQQMGVYPISYGIPDQHLQRGLDSGKTKLFSDIIPGLPYSFDSETEYLNEYRQSYFALTMKKAGWDALRNLEIVSQGALPVFSKARRIPKFTMIHWPKDLLILLETAYKKPNLEPFSEETLDSLGEYVRNHLTSEAMVRYLLEMSEYSKLGRILFLDEYIKENQDYHSIFTVLGLQKIYPERVDILYPPEYLYTSYKRDSSKLYGLGFSYAKRLDRDYELDSRSAHVPHETFLETNSSDYDLIVVGSYRENPRIVKSIIKLGLQEKTIFIYGHDLPPTRGELRDIRRHKLTVFAREIYG